MMTSHIGLPKVLPFSSSTMANLRKANTTIVAEYLKYQKKL